MPALILRIEAYGDDAWALLGLLHPLQCLQRIAFIKAVVDKQITIKGDLKTMILTDTQEVDLAIQPLDKKGKPAQVDGVPAWVSSDTTIITVTPAADGLSAVATAGNIGHAQVTVSADADLGPGVTTITGVLEIDVAGGQAVSLGITAGTPREQAAPAS